MTELHALLRELEVMTVASEMLPPVFGESVDDRLVQARLGVAASLFAALQCKNAAVAGHALRVALSCSGWAMKMGLPEADRDAIEIAALLHDIGMIGAPDQILLKPGTLDEDEAAVMARCTQDEPGHSPPQLRVAAGSGDRREHAGLVRRQPSTGLPSSGSQIPLGARMIAIVEAFDAMTTDHVYRPAFSQERAMAELFECSGTQFDPELVAQFDEFCREDQTMVRGEAASRWLRLLDSTTANSHWELSDNVDAGDRARRRCGVPGPAAGHHVRRGGVHRRRRPGRVVEPRGGAADGHFGRQHSRPVVASALAGALPTKKEAPSARRDCPVLHGDPLRRAIAAAIDDSRAAAAARGRR